MKGLVRPLLFSEMKGNFLVDQSKFIPYAVGVIPTEEMAMRDGLALANSLCLNWLEAESDSLQVINFCIEQTRW